jgi:hypothetical protein
MMASKNVNNKIEHHHPVLDLEQDQWNVADWHHPENAEGNTVSASSSDADGDSRVGYVEVGSPDDVESNEYVQKLMQSADLHIIQPGVVAAAYE